ncbi:MAG: hypothetical protein IAG10_14300 [Planctomycetaceae bacterium]|nr:hypothetical protein [Planctomycetaceae bacterium]
MFKSKRIGVCTFCGTQGPVSDDHIPPKNLFPKPRPSNLITVDACERCNEGFHLEDEYFRVVMALHRDLIGTSEMDRLRPTVLRGLQRSDAPALKRAIEATFETIPLYDADGNVVGEDDVFSAELNRLNSVVIKTTAGLYFKVFGERVDCSSYVGSQDISRLALNRSPLSEVYAALIAQTPAFEWPGIYSARVLQFEPQYTVWRHLFYDRLEFLATTIPEALWNGGKKDAV